jgi:hypothetical protein
MRAKLLGVLIIIFGLLLILDELALIFPYLPVPPSGWLLGDLSAFHVEPYHHWMLGIPLILGGLYLCKL